VLHRAKDFSAPPQSWGSTELGQLTHSSWRDVLYHVLPCESFKTGAAGWGAAAAAALNWRGIGQQLVSNCIVHHLFLGFFFSFHHLFLSYWTVFISTYGLRLFFSSLFPLPLWGSE